MKTKHNLTHDPVTNEPFRVCKICNKKTKLDQFSINVPHPGGIDSRCRNCRNKTAKLQKRRKTLAIKLNLLYEGVSCPICSCITTLTPNKKTSAVIDHCHKTQELRGILCGSCNSALGKFGDDIPLLQKAIAYLNNKTYKIESIQ